MVFRVPIVLCAISEQEFYSVCTTKRTSERDQKFHTFVLEDHNMDLLSCKKYLVRISSVR